MRFLNRQLDRHGASVAVAIVLSLMVGSCGRATADDSASVRVLDVWHGWPQQEAEGLRRVVAEFERTHPGIRVRLSYAANNLTSSQKLFLAIAGGVGPDLTFVDGQQLAEWAARGALVDLTDAAAAAGVRGDDFWLPRWQESVFDGRVYALPLAADPNFALVWNKRLFREAGLDPDKPPTTIAELDAANDKLFKSDAAGRLVQVGLVPWEWGGDNSFFNWAYAFGGEVYAPPAGPGDPGRVTADDPRNVEAMRWMQRTATRYGGVRAIAQFNANFIGSANSPFFLGRVGMTLMHVEQVRRMKRLAPGIEYGVGFIPQPPGVQRPSCWVGGWSLAVPRGRAVSDDAITFMKWTSDTEEGSRCIAEQMHIMPAFRRCSWYETAKADPELSVYYELLRHARHVRTLMPAQGYLMDLLRRSNDEILYGRRDPAAALREVSDKAQGRLEQVVAVAARRQRVEPIGATP